METRVRGTDVHYVEHGEGRPIIVLHGAGVDHRETEACFESALQGAGGFRRIYPDLPGMGRTPAPESLASAEDVLQVLLEFSDAVTYGVPSVWIGHSAGAHYARAMAATHPDRVAGLALVCPFLPGSADIPKHQVLVGSGEIGDDVFRDYFVIQTPEMLDRYERFVRPGVALADQVAMGRIGQRWEFSHDAASPFRGPTLVVAGRLDSTVGYAGAVNLLEDYPHATLAVVDGAGHALPHEQPEILGALLTELLARVDRAA